MPNSTDLRLAAIAIARAHRVKGATHPDTVNARADLLIAHVARLVKAAPPLTAEQADRVAALLRGDVR